MIFKLRLEVGLAKVWGVQKEAEGPGDEGLGGSVVAKESTCAKGLGKRSPGNEGQAGRMSVER